jgi:threonine dehydratase
VTGVDIAAIRAARETIRAEIRETPIWPAPFLEPAAGHPVILKCEHLQRTGSFKIRGALNFVAALSPAESAAGLVTASAGNHAQGVALAASLRGIGVKVVMPVFAPLAKVTAARGYGAEVILHGNSLEQARDHARSIAGADGRRYVPPFDDDAVIAGQGTLGLEVLAQVPAVREVLVPAGGGGLLAGVALAIKSSAPGVRVVGVQSAAMEGIVESLARGQVSEVEPHRTIADGVAVAGPSARTLEIIRRFVDDVLAVPEEAIAHAMVSLLERTKMVVEGAGALGVAAIESGLYRPSGETVVVLSGGNVDINLVGSIIRRGLVDAGRYRHLSIEVSDTPGELARIATVIAREGGNILEVEHDREAPDLPVGVAVLDLVLEIDGPEHFGRILDALRREGMKHAPGARSRFSTEAARVKHEGWE